MDPSGLSAAAFAFGQCFEAAEVGHLRYLRHIFHHIRLASVASLPLFLPREVVSLLRTYARWQVSFDVDHLRKVADRMRACHTDFDLESSVSALYALAQLMQRNAARSVPSTVTSAAWDAAGDAAECHLGPVCVAMSNGKVDMATAQKVLEAYIILRPSNQAGFRTKAALLNAISMCVARRRSELEVPSCTAIHGMLSQLECSRDDDVMLVLAERMAPAPF